MLCTRNLSQFVLQDVPTRQEGEFEWMQEGNFVLITKGQDVDFRVADLALLPLRSDQMLMLESLTWLCCLDSVVFVLKMLTWLCNSRSRPQRPVHSCPYPHYTPTTTTKTHPRLQSAHPHCPHGLIPLTILPRGSSVP